MHHHAWLYDDYLTFGGDIYMNFRSANDSPALYGI
jgi:hypothetical protein